MAEQSPDEGIQLELFPDAGEPRRSPIVAAHRAGIPLGLPFDFPTAPHGPSHPGPGSTPALHQALDRQAPTRPVDIVYTQNRTVILSLRALDSGRYVLRAHECFRSAPPEVADAAIQLYLTKTAPAHRRRLSHLITLYHQQTAAPPETSRDRPLDPGFHHNLDQILARVNAEWFREALDLEITFGDRIARRLMGRHERRSPKNLVVINPILDHPWVPLWYLDFLVYHECLHEVFPPVPSRHRMILHPPEFRARERQHPEFERARKFELWLTGRGWASLRRAAQERKNHQIIPSIPSTPNVQISVRARRGQGLSGKGAP